jgi:8-amino-7-oxononanoate synthase
MYYKKELNALTRSNRLRQRQIFDDSLIDFASNDYLGLSSSKILFEKACDTVRKNKFNSSRSSMIVCGYCSIHQNFEKDLIQYNNFEDAIVVGSGFLANISLIEALVRKKDILFIDEYYHASGILAAKLVQNVVVFKHNDYKDLEDKIKISKSNRIIIAIEGVYSMQGDIAVEEINDIALKYDAILIVDEAHSSGILGDNLLGWYDYYNIKIQSNHIKMGTLSKAYGSYGAYILASTHIVSYLQNKSKAIIYTTAPSLFDIALAHINFLYIMENTIQIKTQIKLYQTIIKQYLHIEIKSLILPVHINDNHKVIQIQNSLKQKGYLIGAIRQPTVPKAILRIILKLDISQTNLKQLCEYINIYNLRSNTTSL